MLNRDSIDQYIQPMTPIPTDLAAKGSNAAPARAVVFDIYGTLFISGSGDIGTTEGKATRKKDLLALMRKYAIKGTVEGLLEALYAGIRNRHAALKEEGVDYPEVNIAAIWMNVLGLDDLERVRAFAVEFEMITNPVYPMPGLAETLAALRRHNVCMGIVSNAQFYTPCLFTWFLGQPPEALGFHPELIFYSYQHDRAKPSRFLFQMACDKLLAIGISAGSALYLGNDMLNDIYAAGRVGFLTALFAGDKRSLRMREDDPRCKDIEPDYVVTDLRQLMNYI